MSVERMFDKLDEKISSLIRSLGLIITILFGSIALLINFKIENIIIKVSILGLIGIFVLDIIFTLALYISTKKDEFVYSILMYEQLLKINRGFIKETTKALAILIREFAIINRKLPSKDVSNCYIEEFIGRGVQKSDDGYYELRIKNLEDFRSGISLFFGILGRIKELIEYVIKGEKEVNNINEMSYLAEFYGFMRLIRTYHTDLSNFEGLKLPSNNELIFDVFDTPHRLFVKLVNPFRFNTISTYNKINKDKLTKMKEYGLNIKLAYGIFGLGIILSSVMIFYALILFFFFN